MYPLKRQDNGTIKGQAMYPLKPRDDPTGQEIGARVRPPQGLGACESQGRPFLLTPARPASPHCR